MPGTDPKGQSPALLQKEGQICDRPPVLPDQLQGKLNLARSRIRSAICSKAGGREVVVEPREACVIEHIEEFRAELNTDALVYRRVLLKHPVEVCERVQAEHVASKISELAQQGLNQRVVRGIRV